MRAGSERRPGSRVEFILEEVPEGTALTVVETPWVPVGEPVHVAPVFVGVPGSLPDPPTAPPRIMLRARVGVWG